MYAPITDIFASRVRRFSFFRCGIVLCQKAIKQVDLMRSLILQKIIQSILFTKGIYFKLCAIVFLLKQVAFRNSRLILLKFIEQSGYFRYILQPEDMTAFDWYGRDI